MSWEISGQSSEYSWDHENAFYWFSHPTRISKLLAQYEIYKMIIEVPGDAIEFGVYKAASFVRLATFRKILENDFSRKLIGFDTFGKFPQDSNTSKSDSFFIQGFENEGGEGLSQNNVQKVLIHKNFENFELVSGDVFDTLPKWLANNPQSRIAFLHLDMDTYAPTKFVLDTVWERLVAGAALVIDDYNAVEGSTLAIDEFLKARKLKLTKAHFYNVPSYLIKT